MIVEDITKLNKEYGLVYADPPWKQSKGGKKAVREKSSGKPLDYPVCTIDEIKEHLQCATNASGGRTQFCFYGLLINIYLKHNQ